MDDRFREQDLALRSLSMVQDEFPVDRSLVCTGLQETPSEGILEKAQDLIEIGLGLDEVEVEHAIRLRSHNTWPGLVQIRLPSVNTKISAL